METRNSDTERNNSGQERKTFDRIYKTIEEFVGAARERERDKEIFRSGVTDNNEAAEGNRLIKLCCEGRTKNCDRVARYSTLREDHKL